ncbi:hypothetical protein CKAH01_02292 [Colletotrichum kahawae]|uniref:Uncharacterized protein n=1 Tax=Colletotrichum kahawae TaxID=34407 RepID=A0AAD9XYA6_COLKA|nr:hypothetical protein CKAH01_02292 [Colletotrichum kahawae]
MDEVEESRQPSLEAHAQYRCGDAPWGRDGSMRLRNRLAARLAQAQRLSRRNLRPSKTPDRIPSTWPDALRYMRLRPPLEIGQGVGRPNDRFKTEEPVERGGSQPGTGASHTYTHHTTPVASPANHSNAS